MTAFHSIHETIRVENLYWSILILAFGGCIGSFLNVVIYRWPLGLSVRKPVRSFCPSCQNQIVWFDNLPVVSYLLLRGRCRRCGIGISLQYPIVEWCTALAFLMVYDGFFNGRLRLGITDLSNDWPILIAHWILVAGLIALTVMDLEAYMVDIRVTWIVSAAGLIGHALWTPASSYLWIRPGVVQSIWALAVTVGLGIGALIFLRRQPPEVLEEKKEADQPVSGDTALPAADLTAPPEDVPAVAAPLPPHVPAWRWMWLVVPVALIAAYVGSMMLHESAWSPVRFTSTIDGNIETHLRLDPHASLRVGAGLLVLFVFLTISASHPREEADAQIVEAIECEATEARRMALRELMLIAPAIVLCFAAMTALRHSAGLQERLQPILHWSVGRNWQPFWGFTTGLAGWAIGGAIGWIARILFTFLFGKEALGMGDVHILAAAGAVAGWPVALFGFFIGAILALLGMGVICLRRQGRMLAYGPWLGLGFFLAVMFQDAIFEYLNIRWLFE